LSDTPGIDHHRELGYVEAEFQLQTGFTVTETAEARGLEISGICPGCGGRTTMALERGSPQGFKGIFRRRNVDGPPAPPRTVTIYCECGHMHTDRPAEAIDNGCGAFWSVELP
jgi:hypothetical protein